MPFQSILFEDVQDRPDNSAAAPDYFSDLNCDQIVDAITTGKDEYNLKPFFYTKLRTVEAIEYRHAVMQDLENPPLLARIKTFAQKMHDMRVYLTRVNKLRYKEQQEAWFLEAIENYCESISTFAQDLSAIPLESAGLIGFREYLTHYARSPAFQSLWSETKRIKAGLLAVKYSVVIKGDRFTVRKFERENDYSHDVEKTFEKFAQGAANDYLVKFKETEEINHIEAKILEFVAKLHPGIFFALEDYCNRNASYLDQTIRNFDREIQFYVAYLDYIEILKQTGLQFCYPQISDRDKEIFDKEGFDIALAHKLVKETATVVCNDFHLNGHERILVVSGPNQGGKTTFARSFGQLHYLGNIGCATPGRDARLFLFDYMFTHFEKQEKVENLRGKLEDDLIRMRAVFEKATTRSIIILNEVFTSTTVQDELFLSSKVLKKVIALDLLCVWVTFVDELASFGPQTVSMVSTVVPDNPALRTFKILRRPADGLAYAMAIVRKYRLTYDAIKERIKS